MALWFRKDHDHITAPLVFLVICILAYGLQSTQLGYYLDDWIILNAYNQGGAERVFEYAFLGNRPLVFWIWVIGLDLFQSVPAYWQVWALLWRWLTVVILWLVFKQIWPNSKRQVTLAALLFAVYPLFSQQASALTYSFHWICFFLWGLSIYCMILAVRQPERFLLWMGLSLLTGGVQLFSQEFFVGLELLRPFILWLVLSSRETDRKNLAKRVALTWAPFLLLLAGFFVWRVRLMPTFGSDRNVPDFLFGLFSSPMSVLPRLIEMFFQDIVQITLGIWYETYRPDLFVFTPISNVVTWAIVIVAFFISLAFFWRNIRQPQQPEDSSQVSAWYKTAIPLGLLAMILGFLPGWMIGKHIYDLSGVYNDRFGLASMFGAALLIVGVVDVLIKTQTYRLVLICLLIGLGTGQNFRYQTTYRWSWENQLKLYWQLKWRAPELRKPTAIFSEGFLIRYMGTWVTTSAFVQMYGQGGDSHFMDQWYFDLTKTDPENFKGLEQIVAESNFMRYRAPSSSNLVIAFEPEKARCLWVLGEADQTNPYLSEKLASAVRFSNLGQILPSPNVPLRSDIFGEEPAHDWCYYFQKGDLARQTHDWQTAASLWNEAVQNGKRPRIGTEYSPFIEGFAHTGDWDTAVELTRKASFPKYEMRASVCSTWKRIADAAPDTPEKQTAITGVIEDFECQDEFRE